MPMHLDMCSKIHAYEQFASMYVYIHSKAYVFAHASTLTYFALSLIFDNVIFRA